MASSVSDARGYRLIFAAGYAAASVAMILYTGVIHLSSPIWAAGGFLVGFIGGTVCFRRANNRIFRAAWAGVDVAGLPLAIGAVALHEVLPLGVVLATGALLSGIHLAWADSDAVRRMSTFGAADHVLAMPRGMRRLRAISAYLGALAAVAVAVIEGVWTGETRAYRGVLIVGATLACVLSLAVHAKYRGRLGSAVACGIVLLVAALGEALGLARVWVAAFGCVALGAFLFLMRPSVAAHPHP